MEPTNLISTLDPQRFLIFLVKTHIHDLACLKDALN